MSRQTSPLRTSRLYRPNTGDKLRSAYPADSTDPSRLWIADPAASARNVPRPAAPNTTGRNVRADPQNRPKHEPKPAGGINGGLELRRPRGSPGQRRTTGPSTTTTYWAVWSQPDKHKLRGSEVDQASCASSPCWAAPWPLNYAGPSSRIGPSDTQPSRSRTTRYLRRADKRAVRK